MRLTQVIAATSLAFTVAAEPILIPRLDVDLKLWDDYKKCCNQRDKHHAKLTCIPPKKHEPPKVTLPHKEPVESKS